MTLHTHQHLLSPVRPGAAPAALTGDGKRAAPQLLAMGATLAVATALLLAGGAQAQTATPAPAAAAAPAEAAEPKYTLAQIAQAFGFIDSNKDGKLSREEAAGFRGVARHFDEADANKDGMLSRQEFEKALSGDKSR